MNISKNISIIVLVTGCLLGDTHGAKSKESEISGYLELINKIGSPVSQKSQQSAKFLGEGKYSIKAIMGKYLGIQRQGGTMTYAYCAWPDNNSFGTQNIVSSVLFAVDNDKFKMATFPFAEVFVLEEDAPQTNFMELARNQMLIEVNKPVAEKKEEKEKVSGKKDKKDVKEAYEPEEEEVVMPPGGAVVGAGKQKDKDVKEKKSESEQSASFAKITEELSALYGTKAFEAGDPRIKPLWPKLSEPLIKIFQAGAGYYIINPVKNVGYAFDHQNTFQKQELIITPRSAGHYEYAYIVSKIPDTDEHLVQMSDKKDPTPISTGFIGKIIIFGQPIIYKAKQVSGAKQP